jgi:hypothetical protein
MKQSTLETGLTELDLNGRKILVMNDYWKLNGVRTPVGLTRAFQIADSMNMRLPTKEIVDAVWSASQTRLAPITMSPTREMTSVAYYTKHNALIEDQLKALGNPSGLIAGHKKDILYIERNSPRVLIYGWHTKSGSPIQPPSTVHHREYFDYSHGLRLWCPA